jgi:cytochrome c
LQFIGKLILVLMASFLTGNTWAEGVGDRVQGAAVFKKCQACHQVGEGAKNLAGPQLNGIFGRTAGGLGGGKYSKSMIHAGGTGDHP